MGYELWVMSYEIKDKKGKSKKGGKVWKCGD